MLRDTNTQYCRQPRQSAHFDELCRKDESDDPDDEPSVYPFDECSLQEGGEPHSFSEPDVHVWYNFARINQALRITPAMASRHFRSCMTVEEIVGLLG